jgi:hypothetical protein
MSLQNILSSLKRQGYAINLLKEQDSVKYIVSQGKHKLLFKVVEDTVEAENEISAFKNLIDWNITLIDVKDLDDSSTLLTFDNYSDNPDWIDRPVENDVWLDLVKQITEIHSLGIIHNNLTIDHILCDDNGYLTIIDFDKSCMNDCDLTFFDDYYTLFMSFWNYDEESGEYTIPKDKIRLKNLTHFWNNIMMNLPTVLDLIRSENKYDYSYIYKFAHFTTWRV